MLGIDPNNIIPTQEQAAKIMGISTRRLRDLQALNILPKRRATLGDQVRAYTSHLRRIAARWGKSDQSEVDL